MPTDTPRDIRQYFSPPRAERLTSDCDQQRRGPPHAHGVTPTGHSERQQQHRTPNRRRIVTSDDDLPFAVVNGHSAAEIPNAKLHHHDHVDPAIVIESSEEDESDDIWVRPRHDVRQQHHEQPPAHIQPHATPSQQQQHLASPRNRRRQQPQPHQTTPRQRRRLEAAAVESAASNDESSDCIESDTNAQDLYRSAIRGVRNARHARQQIRSVTEHCPVCSKFAVFLAHFT
jgi:hypothetical protein